MPKTNKLVLILVPVILLVLAFTSYFAWQNYQKKPNEIQQSSVAEVKPFVADNEHEVAVLEECDLAVKFKKGVEIQKTSTNNFSLSKSGETETKKVFVVQCFDVLRSGTTPKANSSYFADNLLKDKSVFYDGLDGSSKTKNGEIVNLVNNKTVVISDDFDFKQEFDISLQPNSLAPSTASVKLEDKVVASPAPQAPRTPTPTPTDSSVPPAKPTDSSNNQDLTEIKLYLGDTTKIYNNCGATEMVTRKIPRTESAARASLFELFKGETNEEKSRGLVSAFKNWNDVFGSINLKEDGTLQIDFKKEVLPKVQSDGSFADQYGWGTLGSSCGSGQMQQLRQTMKQFPTVKYVIFSVNGELQSPDNFIGCPEDSNSKPENLENEKWEELKRQCGV